MLITTPMLLLRTSPDYGRFAKSSDGISGRELLERAFHLNCMHAVIQMDRHFQ